MNKLDNKYRYFNEYEVNFIILFSVKVNYWLLCDTTNGPHTQKKENEEKKLLPLNYSNENIA